MFNFIRKNVKNFFAGILKFYFWYISVESLNISKNVEMTINSKLIILKGKFIKL